eukprot:CAMPEP_0114973778 /NCGR_PEP_ID=MMETSP0216-20121206/1150_1 /TAXON_ID=223996 /ORGANISM="Protocruzia adherens, Strain Boccale" /LENGTH=405 /DNA_ID=CAMNT_0002334321 /DNA_START=106 /DNA_END=1323 /DNA_ORIENTATION=+
MTEPLKKEITLMKLLSHPNVVELIEVLASRSKIYVVLELIKGGDLFDFIQAEGALSEERARKYFHQMFSALEYCHGEHIVHRDLKPENILIDENGNVKISDFGFSALFKQNNLDMLHTTCGTVNYIAPEVINDHGYDGTGADIWSLGVTLYFITSASLPFNDENTRNLLDKIVQADFTFPKHFSKNFKDLLTNMLQPDPRTRYTIEAIKGHPWFMRQDYVEPSREVHLLSLSGSDLNRTYQAVNDGLEKEGGDLYAETMNGFELINFCTGALMNRMFDTGDLSRMGKKTHSNAYKTQFTSRKPLGPLIGDLNRFIDKFTAPGRSRPDIADNAQIIGTVKHGKNGEVKICCQVYTLVDGLYLVSFKRLEGKIEDFCAFYEEFYPSVQHLVLTKENDRAGSGMALID